MTTADVLQRIRAARVVPVIVIDDAANAVPLTRALTDGGLVSVEITFRTSHGADSIRRIAAECPDILLGAGTVLTPGQAAGAMKAGAQFVVAPGFSPAVVDFCMANGVPVFPGICTPTELEAAMAMGVKAVKFFPAEPSGGLAYLAAMASPYSGIEFIPTGGIDAANLSAYLAFDRVAACGGSWMAPADWIAARRFDLVTEESARAAAVAGLKVHA